MPLAREQVYCLPCQWQYATALLFLGALLGRSEDTSLTVDSLRALCRCGDFRKSWMVCCAASKCARDVEVRL